MLTAASSISRTPELRFFHDHSIERGNRIESILTELRESGAHARARGEGEAEAEGGAGGSQEEAD